MYKSLIVSKFSKINVLENSLFAKVERLQELQKKWTDDIKIYYQIKRQWRYKVKSLETKVRNSQAENIFQLLFKIF